MKVDRIAAAGISMVLMMTMVVVCEGANLRSRASSAQKQTGEAKQRSLQESTDEGAFTEEAVAAIIASLSGEQILLAHELFDEYDVQQSSPGELTYAELMPRDFQTYMAADLDGDLKLTFDEFLGWLVRTGVFAPPPPMPTGTLEKLSQEQRDSVANYESWFNSTDTDDDGNVTKAELDAYLPTETQFLYDYLYDAIEALQSKLPQDVEARLDFEAFLLVGMQHTYPSSIFGDSATDGILAMFKSVDPNKDGYLDAYDYEAQENAWLKDSIETIRESYDYDGDSRVSYSEFFVGEMQYL